MSLMRAMSAGKKAIRTMAFKKAAEGETQVILYLHRVILGYPGDQINITNNTLLVDVSQEAKDHLVHLCKHIYELADSDEPNPRPPVYSPPRKGG
jgi:hypothetical protein